ncbi:MAG: histidine phosphatase family protein [Pseudomonadota bacterium]
MTEQAPPETEFHLVRHGETEWNAAGRVQGQAESRLSARGLAQAAALGTQLDIAHYDAVYCSSSVRTRQTLDGVLAGRPCKPVFRDALREIHLGPWQRKLRTEVTRVWPRAFDHFLNAPERFALEGAETVAELQHRGCSALSTIAAAQPGQRVLVISHGALIKAVYCVAAGLPLSALWSGPQAQNCARFVVVQRPDGALRFVAHHPGGDALCDGEVTSS